MSELHSHVTMYVTQISPPDDADSMNYSTLRVSHIVKHAVTPHHSSKGYRDVPLQIGELLLEKKKYERGHNR